MIGKEAAAQREKNSVPKTTIGRSPTKDNEAALPRSHSVGTAGKIFLGAPGAWGTFPKAHPIRTEEDRFHCPTCNPAQVPAQAPGEFDRSLAEVIDHTLLDPAATGDRIQRLCEEAKRFSFASVCVNPFWVRRCRTLLEGSRVKVCAVASFPFGASTGAVKAFEAAEAAAGGAQEVDVVINVGALKSGDDRTVLGELGAVRGACAGRILKVIIEASLLTRAEKIAACRFAQEAGADFVKTSTGFGGGGATVEDVALMRETVGESMGIKASGGIRTADFALKLLAAGATRIGTSHSVALVTEKSKPAWRVWAL